MNQVPIKTCPKCKEPHPATSEFFNRDRYKSSGLSSWCITCSRSRKKAWKMANKDKVREYDRKRYASGLIVDTNLQRNYGITLDQYDQMCEAQDGVCAACGGINPDGKRLAVDHDHKTGKVRGLLCSNCNLAIGNLKENPELFIKVLHYLIKSR